MLHRWPSSPAHMNSSCGQRTKWATVTVGLTLRLMQQQRPTRNIGPLTRPRRPRLAVVLLLLLDSWALWRYTGFGNAIAFASFVLLLLALRLMLWSEEKNPHRTCHPVGVLLCPHDIFFQQLGQGVET